ncbi:hypothetical protein [Aporhodopirellula aestuarii]|uniref:Uncharacterized protein n=1 Tax=Aporhodopirellula aestuarii TaxID=2950107 RepID=A0ABT0TZE2_9BACT|nr:hypothetical protein [Aporhodopirellula aestuarii]MCM2369895.1 hypothetical protein [Aporhodopirellula aestuarii]
MAKEDLPPISEDTIEMIESQVKKGKARKFFLIYKGASIKTLVVFKKGPFGPKIMKAKKDGFKGDVCYGVVTGSGKNLFFQLPANGEVAAAMKVESWEEKPPTKKAKLREFLNGCGLSFKPEFNMITKISDAPDPESESDIPVPPPPPGSAVAEDDESRVPKTEEKETGDDPMSAYKERFQSILPRIKDAAGSELGLDAKLKASESGVFARKKDFDTAHDLLDQAEEILDGKKPSSPDATTSDSEESPDVSDQTPETSDDVSDAFREMYEGLLTTVPGDLRKLAKNDSATAEKIQKVIDGAAAEATKGDYAKAFELLNKASDLIAKFSSRVALDAAKDVIPENVVRERQKFVQSRWQETMRAVYVSIEDIRPVVAEMVPGEDPDGLVNAIQEAIDDFCDELNEAILATSRATSQDVSSLETALELVDRYLKEVPKDRLIQHLEQSATKLGVSLGVQDSLIAALRDLKVSLSA